MHPMTTSGLHAATPGDRTHEPLADVSSGTFPPFDARVVIAGVEAYLRFAEACGRIDLMGGSQRAAPPGLAEAMGAGSRTEIGAAKRRDD